MIPPELISADLTAPRSGVEETLGVVGVKTVPNMVDVAAVHLGYDVGAGGFAKTGVQALAGGSAISIAAVSSGRFLLVAPTGFTVAGSLNSTPYLSLAQQNARIIGVGVTLNLNAAGAIAMNGLWVRMLWELRNLTNTINSHVAVSRVQIVTGTIQYHFALENAFWSGWVPQELAATATLLVEDATNFPAASTALVKGLFVSVRKVGAQLPR